MNPTHEKYLNKKIDMYDEMATVVGKDVAREVVPSHLMMLIYSHMELRMWKKKVKMAMSF